MAGRKDVVRLEHDFEPRVRGHAGDAVDTRAVEDTRGVDTRRVDTRGVDTGRVDTGRVDSLWANTDADQQQQRSSSPVWHFNFTVTPEFVFRPVDVASSTPSPHFC